MHLKRRFLFTKAPDELRADTRDFDTQHPDTMASFKSQLEFLLTSQERKAVKRALRHYKEDK